MRQSTSFEHFNPYVVEVSQRNIIHNYDGAEIIQFLEQSAPNIAPNIADHNCVRPLT